MVFCNKNLQMISAAFPDECHMYCDTSPGEAISYPFQSECSLIPSVNTSDTFLCLSRGNLKLSLDATNHFLPSGSSDQYSRQILSSLWD